MKAFLLILALFSFRAFACDLTLEQRRAPVWYDGQMKSFQVASYYTVKKLFKGVSTKKAASFYCLLVSGTPEAIQNHPLYKKSEIDYFKHIDRLPKIFKEANKIENKKERDRALSRYDKMKTFKDVLQKKHMMVFDKAWKPLVNIAPFSEATLKLSLDASASMVSERHFLYENFIYEYSLLGWGFTALFLAFVLTFVPFKAQGMAFNSLVGISFLLQCLVVTFRVLYSGRAPIANMYETVLLTGPLAIFIGAFFYKKNHVLYKFSALYGLGTLGTLMFSGNMLDSEIKNIMPVLRDNFWLSTHVTSIVFAYSVLGISWLLANFVLVKKVFKKELELEQINNAITIALKYGSFFLFMGILLGAIWADYSWGRFWAWDPKETWSLIAFLVYMLLFHAVRGNLIKKDYVHVYVSLAFISILIAWFGVNFVLSSGLHTYGFSYGGTIFLSTLVLIQLAIAFIYVYRFEGRMK